MQKTAGNKDARAAAIIRHLFEGQEDTDEAVLDLLNHLFVEDSAADLRMEHEEYRRLDEKVLQPRGIRLSQDGYSYADTPAGQTASSTTRRPAWPPAASPGDPTTTGRGATSMQGGLVGSQPRPGQSVFVVHGRDMRPVGVLRQFLFFIGLRMMSWSEAVSLTGNPQPHTYDIVKTGIDAAAAVIVIFSPDDEARINPALAEAGDPDLHAQGQARQNVILEAGMAFASAPAKTIFVKSAPTREISDIHGFNWVKLDGRWDSRQDLVNRLENAGAPVRVSHANLADPLAGPFMVEHQVEPVTSPAARPLSVEL
ncbi:TIR domain-containing protein [Georgenia sp. AZ-5]|uniref:TIR domain-containing protein n=1 Tax=Georgenia sp. AZ-5 TaxID=3367526 RepID=UPI0037553C5A